MREGEDAALGGPTPLWWLASAAALFGALALLGCYRFPVNGAARFLPAAEADFIAADDLVLGVASGSGAWAFPVPALAPIEVLNASIGDLPVAVTW